MLMADRAPWRSLFYADAQVVRLVWGRPRGFDPPRGPSLGVRTHDGGRPSWVFARRLALPHDVEGRRLGAVLLGVLLDLADGLGRNAGRFGTPAGCGREHPVVA